jgi:pilus assembly protein Flp/PilA
VFEEGVAVLLRLYAGATAWWNDLKGRAEEQIGATAVEYALMVALIAIVIIAAVAFVGHAVSNKFSTVGSGVNNA